MKVLIYEDNQNDIDVLLKMLNTYFNEKQMIYHYFVCNDLKTINHHLFDSDLVFLDIEGPNENGIDIGIYIRKNKPDIKIIFISNYTKYLIDGYKASANRYFLKPLKYETFSFELENVIQDYLLNETAIFDISISYEKIYIKNILYIESLNKKSLLHLTNNKTIVSPYPLYYWKEKLFNHPFSQCYKSYLVHLTHINKFTKKSIILSNNETLPISRKFKEEFELKYINYLKMKT